MKPAGTKPNTAMGSQHIGVTLVISKTWYRRSAFHRRRRDPGTEPSLVQQEPEPEPNVPSILASFRALFLNVLI
jgi:hypothetical protein